LAADAGIVTVERIVHLGRTRARQTGETRGEVLGVRVQEAEGVAA
jgi:hypothetical protein